MFYNFAVFNFTIFTLVLLSTDCLSAVVLFVVSSVSATDSYTDLTVVLVIVIDSDVVTEWIGNCGLQHFVTTSAPEDDLSAFRTSFIFEFSRIGVLGRCVIIAVIFATSAIAAESNLERGGGAGRRGNQNPTREKMLCCRRLYVIAYGAFALVTGVGIGIGVIAKIAKLKSLVTCASAHRAGIIVYSRLEAICGLLEIDILDDLTFVVRSVCILRGTTIPQACEPVITVIVGDCGVPHMTEGLA